MTPTIQDSAVTIYNADALEALRALPSESVQCCVTSPPYCGLRDYGVAGQIGLERTPEEFIEKMVAVFREVRRVLRKDGTCWVNMGDCYATGAGAVGKCPGGGKQGENWTGPSTQPNRMRLPGLKPKDLVGVPWMLAFALRSDGWYLRQDIIWSKPNCMPESVRDRCTKSHEYIFMLTKSERYFYDAEAIREPATEATIRQVGEGYNGEATKDFIGSGVQDASATKSRIIDGLRKRIDRQRGHSRRHDGFNDRWDSLTKQEQQAIGSNKRSVWRVSPANYAGSHFATFPPDLIKPCILAGTRAGDVVLDPFAGSGTTGEVALDFGRRAVLIELNPNYIPFIAKRTSQRGLELL